MESPASCRVSTAANVTKPPAQPGAESRRGYQCSCSLRSRRAGCAAPTRRYRLRLGCLRHRLTNQICEPAPGILAALKAETKSSPGQRPGSKDHKNVCPEGATQTTLLFEMPFRAEKSLVIRYPGRCPGLLCFGPSAPASRNFFRYGFQLCRKSPDKDQRDDCRRASLISSARRAASSSARSSSYKEKRSFGSGAIIRCKTRAVGPDTFGAIARNSDGRCFNAYKSVAEFVLLSIGAFPATA